MDHAQISASPIKLEPLALILRLSSGELATIPLGPSPFAGGKGTRIELKMITPTDYWLVRSSSSLWHLRMIDPDGGVFEIRLPKGLIELITDIAREQASSAPRRSGPTANLPRRRGRAVRIQSTVIALLASSRGSHLLIGLEESQVTSCLEGRVQLADRFNLSLDGPPERWTIGLGTIDHLRIIAPIPLRIGTTIHEMMLQANRPG